MRNVHALESEKLMDVGVKIMKIGKIYKRKPIKRDLIIYKINY